VTANVITLKQDLINLAAQAAKQYRLPAIKQLVLPRKHLTTDSKYTKFGLLVLEDNSSGFFYRLAGSSSDSNQQILARLHERAAKLPGTDPAAVSQLLGSSDAIDAGIGMAAINAISQHVFTQENFIPPALNKEATDTQAWTHARHLGMVGYFGPTVAHLGRLNIPVTIIELDKNLHHRTELVTVTGDVSALQATDHIICTASTLLNGTLQGLLDEYADGRFFELVGPTCGCFAEPLLARGVDQMGGSRVVDVDAACGRIEHGKSWGLAVEKYMLNSGNYPRARVLP